MLLMCIRVKLYPLRFLFVWILLFLGNVYADTGTLVVTYHTGRNNERIDRVLIRLVNKKQEARTYPQEGIYCDEGLSHLRRIVIPNLPVGKYFLEFILPNTDGLFTDIPKREITISAHSLVSVDQSIKPRYARVHAQISCELEHLHEAPTATLHDEEGRMCGKSKFGELFVGNLAPGNYTLIFDPKEGFETPTPIHFSLAPGATAGPYRRVYTRSSSIAPKKA